MKTTFRRLHLYMALAAGVVIMISCFTGALLVFQEDLEHSFNKRRYYVQPLGQRLTIQQLVANVKAKKPEAKIANIRIYNDATRSVELSYRESKGKQKQDKAKQQKSEDNSKAYINPYTGEVIEFVETKKTFFAKVLNVHRFLLASDVGKLITGISTLIFVFIIITGLILWWPANKNILKQRLKIKRDAGWKRTNHDWHLVFGFYSSIFLFIFAFTALAWSFKWFNNSIYYVTNSPVKNPEPPKSKPTLKPSKDLPLDWALHIARVERPDAVYYGLSLPKGDSDVIAVTTLRSNASLETATDMIYIDRNTGKAVGHLYWNERSTGSRVRSAFKPIHTASVFGTPSKLLGFLACLFGASLPVTGIIIWINRIRKKK